MASRQAELSLFTPLLSVGENTLRQGEEISCHALRPQPLLFWGQWAGLAVGRVLCRAQGHSPGEGGVSAWGKKKRKKSCSSSCAPSAAARGASPAPCGMFWACGSLWRSRVLLRQELGNSCGCCVTLGSLSSQTVPSPGDPGANPLVRGFFPSFSHCHSALCWFGALGVCPAGSSVWLLPWLSKG